MHECLLQNLAEIKGLSDAKIEKLVEAAKKLDTKSGWQTAATVEKQVMPPAFTHYMRMTQDVLQHGVSCAAAKGDCVHQLRSTSTE